MLSTLLAKFGDIPDPAGTAQVPRFVAHDYATRAVALTVNRNPHLEDDEKREKVWALAAPLRLGRAETTRPRTRRRRRGRGDDAAGAARLVRGTTSECA